MYDVDEEQAKEAKIIIEGECLNDRIARIWAAGLAADIDNKILQEILKDYRCQQAHNAEKINRNS